MLQVIVCGVLILSVHFAYAQVLDPNLDPSITRNSNRQRSSDPVAVFLSGLGNLMLDIDETFSRQTAPKVKAEDEMKEQMYGRPRSGANYFNRIRENYKDVQKRLGQSLGILDLRMSSDLGSVNIQNKGPESLIDVSLPSLPMKLAVSSNRGLKVDNNNDKSKDIKTEHEEISPRFRSSFKLGNSEINMDSKIDPLQPSELLKNVENQIKKTLEDIRLTNDKKDGFRTEENAKETKLDKRPDLGNELNLGTKVFSSRSENKMESSEPMEVEDSSPEGRILGDALYSESTFDKLTKRVMKDVKWAIDPKAFPSQAVEKLKQLSNKATERVSPKKTQEETISKITSQPKRDFSKQEFKKRKSLKPLSNDLETVLVDENTINFLPQQDINMKFETLDSTLQKDSIILAFTPEGVPLKLRMGPEIINPLKFLHKVLGSYGVSLNIPVVSYDDIEPVGREILQLGTGSGGTMTRALYIDLSDSFQLESLLRTLRSAKMLKDTRSEGIDQENFENEIQA